MQLGRKALPSCSHDRKKGDYDRLGPLAAAGKSTCLASNASYRGITSSWNQRGIVFFASLKTTDRYNGNARRLKGIKTSKFGRGCCGNLEAATPAGFIDICLPLLLQGGILTLSYALPSHQAGAKLLEKRRRLPSAKTSPPPTAPGHGRFPGARQQRAAGAARPEADAAPPHLTAPAPARPGPAVPRAGAPGC